MRRLTLTACCLVAVMPACGEGAVVAPGGSSAAHAGPAADGSHKPGAVSLPPSTTPSTHQVAYEAEKSRIDAKRKRLLTRLESARTAAARREVLEAARAWLPGAVERLTTFWMGTPWEFYGMSEQPRQGAIACGYFVSTVLRDAGFRLERVKLAQQAAGHIIRTFLTGRDHIHHFRGVSAETFASKLEPLSDGLYLVGLDIHVGFILKRRGEAVFIHSSYYDPPLSVVRQPILERSPLTDSRYRMLGNLTADDRVIERWLRGITFPTRTR